MDPAPVIYRLRLRDPELRSMLLSTVKKTTSFLESVYMAKVTSDPDPDVDPAPDISDIF
jgi:hypothetical protein